MDVGVVNEVVESRFAARESVERAMRQARQTADDGAEQVVHVPAASPRSASPESQKKVQELMAEIFHSSLLDPSVRTPRGSTNPILPKRTARAGVGLAARTAGGASSGMRTGPSRSAAAAAVSRTLAAVDARIVGVMAQEDSVVDKSPRVELALLANLRRSLHGQATVMADDVVLCDSVAEFADAVPPLLADLQAGGKRRLKRLVDYSRELLAQLTALGGPAAEIKPQVVKVRALIDQLADDITAADAKLKPASQETLALYKRVCDELERRSPRPSSSMLDAVSKI